LWRVSCDGRKTRCGLAGVKRSGTVFWWKEGKKLSRQSGHDETLYIRCGPCSDRWHGTVPRSTQATHGYTFARPCCSAHFLQRAWLEQPRFGMRAGWGNVKPGALPGETLSCCHCPSQCGTMGSKQPWVRVQQELRGDPENIQIELHSNATASMAEHVEECNGIIAGSPRAIVGVVQDGGELGNCLHPQVPGVAVASKSSGQRPGSAPAAVMEWMFGSWPRTEARC